MEDYNGFFPTFLFQFQESSIQQITSGHLKILRVIYPMMLFGSVPRNLWEDRLLSRQVIEVTWQTLVNPEVGSPLETLKVIRALIIHQVFSFARNWSKNWGGIKVIFLNFQNCLCCEKYLEDE